MNGSLGASLSQRERCNKWDLFLVREFYYGKDLTPSSSIIVLNKVITAKECLFFPKACTATPLPSGQPGNPEGAAGQPAPPVPEHRTHTYIRTNERQHTTPKCFSKALQRS